MPSTTPMTKPRTVSSSVTKTCSHSGPWAVPWLTQMPSWFQIPDGWPKKNLSMAQVAVSVP